MGSRPWLLTLNPCGVQQAHAQDDIRRAGVQDDGTGTFADIKNQRLMRHPPFRDRWLRTQRKSSGLSKSFVSNRASAESYQTPSIDSAGPTVPRLV